MFIIDKKLKTRKPHSETSSAAGLNYHVTSHYIFAIAACASRRDTTYLTVH